MVMKSAEDRHRCDAAYVLDGAMDRSVFAKRPMSPQLVAASEPAEQQIIVDLLHQLTLGTHRVKCLQQ
jgi:hypothetical protein